MRERKSFAQRAKILQSDEARKKYFLVYEGEKTELRYFEAVNELREEPGLALNPLIELVPIVRSYSEDGWSNPKKIVKRLIENIEEERNGTTSYETLLNWLMEYLQDQGNIANDPAVIKGIWVTLLWICEEKLKVSSLRQTVDNLQETCEKIITFLSRETGLEGLMVAVTEIIDHAGIIYAEGLDKICFIVDRDKESFTADQYDYVLEECQKRRFGLYLTNPCFEFWLLMHFDDVSELDQEQLLENPKITSKRRYAEQELRKRIPGYTKSEYDAMALVRNVDIAIQNEKKFCEDINGLKNTVGSNVGLLICEMRR